MKRRIRLIALGLAIAVNGAALMAVNASMIAGVALTMKVQYWRLMKQS